MVRGNPWVGALLGLGLVGCSGVTPMDGGATERSDIIGGQNDSTHRGVFGVVIKNQALCSASLILPNLLLTARHCVADVSTGDGNIDCKASNFGTPYAPSSFVASWAADLTGTVQPSAIFDVDKVYVPTAPLVCGNDIALLRLTTNVASTAAATIIPRVDMAPMTDEGFSAVGYGLTDPNDTQGATAGIRRSAGGLNVGCVGAVDCAGTRATDTEWAANSAICHGDSGGPALDAQEQVIGVASRADVDCALGLYSSVSSWSALIVDAATDAADQGGYDPPAWAGGTTTPPDAGAPDAGVAGGPTMGAGGSSTGGTAGSSAGGRGGSAGRASGGRASGGSATGGSASGGRSSGTGGGAGTATVTPLPDAGVPPDASAPLDGGGLVDTGPGLGEKCDTNNCFGDLVCYTGNGKPPGTCVPPCTSLDKTCPAQYECNAHINACVPVSSGSSSDSSTKQDSGCGCRVATESSSTGATWPLMAVFAAAGSVLRRRRRAGR